MKTRGKLNFFVWKTERNYAKMSLYVCTQNGILL